MRGFSQKERFPRALNKDYVLPQEFTFYELLDLARALSGNIVFYNEKNEPYGTWEQMFLKDEAFLLAAVMSVRLNENQERFSIIEGKLKKHNKLGQGLKYIQKLFELVMSIPVNVVHWHAYFEDYRVRKNVPQMEMELSGALKKLKTDVNVLMDLKDFLNTKLPDRESLPWNPILEEYKEKDRLSVIPESLIRGGTQSEVLNYVRETIRSLYEAFYATALFLKENSKSYFEASLESENHQPHAALLIAFCGILRHAHTAINRFSQNHRDFYFNEVLKIKKKKPTPDKAVLSFALGKTFKQVLIPKGTLFSAGKDQNNDEILFETTNELLVNKAAIADIRTLFVAKDQLYSPQGMRTPMVSGIYEADVDLSVNESLEESWPTVGEVLGAYELSETITDRKSALGFQVSSPNLLLLEGKRNITFTFNMVLYARSLKAQFRRFNDEGNEVVPLLNDLLLDYTYSLSGNTDPAQQDAGDPDLLGVLDFLDGITEEVPFNPDTQFFNAWFQALRMSYHHEDSEEPTLRSMMNRMAERGQKTAEEVTLDDLYNSVEHRVHVNRKDSVWMDYSRHTDTFHDWKGTPQFYEAVLKGAFEVQLTTASGWVSVVPRSLRFLSIPQEDSLSYQFAISVQLDEDFEPLIALQENLHDEGVEQMLPAASFTLAQDTSVYAYSLLSEGRLEEITLATHSQSIRNVKAYNQLGQLATEGAFQPFGPLPDSNSHLRIGTDELMGKDLSALHINLEWIGLPQGPGGFAEHYNQYPSKPSNSSFQVCIKGLSKGNWEPKRGAQYAYLFNGTTDAIDAQKPSNGPLSLEKKIKVDLNTLGNFNKGTLGVLEPFANTIRSGYLLLELNGEQDVFGHKAYPGLLSKASMEYSRALMEKMGLTGMLKKEPTLYLPQEPYTPLLNRVTLDYTTHSSIKFGPGTTTSTEEGVFSQIHPFNKRLASPQHIRPLLVPLYSDEGNLFIGFKDLKAPQTLNLFFHLLESDVSLGLGKHYVSWHYLSEDVWQPFEPGQVLSDGTNELLNSGVVSLEIPQSISKGNHLLDSELYWIKACIPFNSYTVGSAITLTVHALEVTWTPKNGSKGGHLLNSLPANSITSLKDDLPGIKGLSQPIESYGGRPVEDERQRIIRITERLSHKERAVTPWDYEKLVLEHFPAIKKAKCFPATSMSNPKGKTPGTVLIGLIPRVEYQKTLDHLKPVVNNRQMVAVRDFLFARSSIFAKVEVTNPHYEKVRVICKVKFMDGMSGGYYIQTLNTDLNNHIAPWQVDREFKALFGGSLLESNILGFIQSRPYVHYVTELSILHLTEDYDDKNRLFDTARDVDSSQPDKGKAMVKGLFPWSILVPDKKHQIQVLNEEGARKPEPVGIERMAIGGDFVINEEQ